MLLKSRPVLRTVQMAVIGPLSQPHDLCRPPGGHGHGTLAPARCICVVRCSGARSRLDLVKAPPLSIHPTPPNGVQNRACTSTRATVSTLALPSTSKAPHTRTQHTGRCTHSNCDEALWWWRAWHASVSGAAGLSGSGLKVMTFERTYFTLAHPASRQVPQRATSRL